MKISSASKKVLASALSAAMVVAFAPTVAFAGNGTKIAVTLDLDGGTVVSGNVEFPTAEQNDTIALPVVKKGEVAANVWKYDTNNDGVINGSDTVFNGTLPTDRTAVTLKAFYEQPTLGTAIVDTDGALKVIVKGAADLDLTIDGYSVVFYGATGAQLGTMATGVNVFGTGYTLDKNSESSFVKSTVAAAAAGTYRAVLKDAEGNVLETKLIEVAKVEKSDTADVYAVKGQKINLGSTVYKVGDTDEIAAGSAWKVPGSVKLTAVTTPAYASAFTLTGKTVGITLSNCGTATGTEYSIAIDGDNGISYAGKLGTAATALNVSFDQAAAGARFSGDIAAGTYTVAVTKTVKAEGQADVVTVSKTKFTISEIKVSAGEGSFKAGQLTGPTDRDYFTINGATATTPTTAIADVVAAPEGKVASKWEINGKKYANGVNFEYTEGAVNTLTAVYVADANKYLGVPTIESATYDKATSKWTVKLGNLTTGAVVRYNETTTAPASATADTKYDTTKGIETDAAAISVAVFPVTGVTASGALGTDVTFVNKSAQFGTFDAVAAGSNLELYIGKSTVKWLEQEGIKAAIDAGKTVKKDTGYATVKAWGKAELAAVKAVYEATAAATQAELAKYADGAYVAVGEKVYTIKAADLKVATDGLAKVAADAAKAELATDYQNAINAAVQYANGALNKAVDTKLAKADIDAAAAVTAQLKAATTGAEAEAALAAFTALSVEQQKLVAVADIAAAEKVRDEAAKAAAEAEAAAQLVKEQDIAAVKYVNSTKTKTVKLATAKKGTASITYKSKVSASGNVVTYAKVSGAKIKVAKTGKVTLKKVTKAGTYTGKVKVTCGDATRTVKVKFFVK